MASRNCAVCPAVHTATAGRSPVWRLLNPAQQALLVLVYLRKDETYTELAAGFEVSESTAWRYVEEVSRVNADRPYFSGKHRVHGMNAQVIAGPDGTILWTARAMPGKVHDPKAAWVWGILRELERAGILVLVDKEATLDAVRPSRRRVHRASNGPVTMLTTGYPSSSRGTCSRTDSSLR
jgi:hypothetical protein